MALRSWAGTHVGRVRPHNDNAFFHSSRRGVFLVANGVGGDRRGGAASAILLKHAQGWADRYHELCQRPAGPPPRPVLLQAMSGLLHESSQAVYEAGIEDAALAGMCTTAVVAAVRGYGIALAHVGQNRAYHVRQGRARQLTSDHTVAQALVERGSLAQSEVARSRYRHVLTRTVGHLPTVDVEALWLDALPGDVLVLCSKGLADHLELGDVADLAGDPERFVERAIELGNERGGLDNLTAVIVQFGDGQEAPVEVGAAGAGRAAGAPQPDVPPPAVDTESRIAALRELPLLEHLSDQELLRVLRVVYDRVLAAGEIICAEGTPGDELFIIADGSVLVTKEGVDLTTLGRGRHFGDVSFIEGAPRSATTRALTPVTLLILRREDFLRSLAVEDPRLSTKLLWGLCQHVSRRLRELSHDFVEVAKGAAPAPPAGGAGSPPSAKP